MCQTGQTILMHLFESTGGISRHWLDRLVLVDQLYQSVCVSMCRFYCISGRHLSGLFSDINREVGLNKNHKLKCVHAYKHAHIK